MPYAIDRFEAPLFVTWQITHDCDLACLHCWTESAPGKRLRDELAAGEVRRLAGDIAGSCVPYATLTGGEPLVSPHFFAIAEALGAAGVRLKVETNGQRLDRAAAARLARLPIRSIQVSLDGDTQATYERVRPNASLAKAHAACEAVRAEGLALEVAFAPTRWNLDEAETVLARARALGAVRFNTLTLMRVGAAVSRWEELVPPPARYDAFRDMLARQAALVPRPIEIGIAPLTAADALRAALADPPAALLVLPNGWVKVAAALPHVCADLRQTTLARAWLAYRNAWRDPALLSDAYRAIGDDSRCAAANAWQLLPGAAAA